MTSRSSSSLLTNLLLVAVGVVVGLAVVKVPEFLQTETPAAAASPGSQTMTHKHAGKPKNNFLENVRFTGSFGSDGWKGAATYTHEHGGSMKLGSKISDGGVEEIEAVAAYKSHDWEWYPDLEFAATKVPGEPGAKLSAKMAKTLHQGVKPRLSATLTNTGLILGAAASKAVNNGVKVDVDVRMPMKAKGKVDLIVDTETSIKVGSGKVVGKLGGEASGGLESVRYAASYDLG
eukprot:CAMPEP_0171241008 /NCGR_PEP_ID=MMETSP0790-20130122/44846_1 /TAXON_ID=2925 /ORGANISM="Alexandrium catenella, Strain OF101" /LENGTH=232 /DNA_ID=CAMNT_0011707549 /DNA_START=5 /DNA_END=700 /DNA_ORIENTATION=-